MAAETVAPVAPVVAPRKVWSKLVGEMKTYLGIVLYLWLCFAAILFYKGAVLAMHDIDYAPYGLAFIKAFILGKFILIGHAIHLAEGKGRPAAHAVLVQSVVFVVLLAALSMIEEAVRGAIHGDTLGETLREIGDKRWEFVATCVLMWLILVPYLGFRRIREVVGYSEMHRMLFAAPNSTQGFAR